MIHKVQVTDNLRVELDKLTIRVVSTIPFDIEIDFEEDEQNKPGGLLMTIDVPKVYKMTYKAIAHDKEVFYGSSDIKEYKQDISEIAKLFDFAYANRFNWFELIGMDGELCKS